MEWQVRNFPLGLTLAAAVAAFALGQPAAPAFGAASGGSKRDS